MVTNATMVTTSSFRCPTVVRVQLLLSCGQQGGVLHRGKCCVESEKTAKLEPVLFVYRQLPQLKLANKFGNLNSIKH